MADTLNDLAASVKKGDPMFWVRDMRETVRWYQALGFTVIDHYEDGDDLIFARLGFGACEFTLSPGATTGPQDVRLWFYTNRVEDLYRHFKARRLDVETGHGVFHEALIPFDEDLYEPFYGGRQFSIRDPNGLSLIFWQPDWLAPSPAA